MKTWAEYPIAPVVGWGRRKTQEIRDFITATEGVRCVRMPVFGRRGEDPSFTLVDREDWISLELWRWRWAKQRKSDGSESGYIFRSDGRKNYYLHRVILGIVDAGRKIEGDHANGNTFDNRRCGDDGKPQLRAVTISQNRQNTSIRRDSGSGRKGVYFQPRESASNPWNVTICAGRKIISIGRFKTREAAIEARRAAERKYHGQFAASEERAAA